MKPVVVEPLYTSTERLLAVADLLEGDPRRYHQTSWNERKYPIPLYVAQERTCGTYGCMAGWGAAFMPVEEVRPSDFWYEVGAAAFGIDAELASVIFSGSYTPQRDARGKPSPATLLRGLATIPEGQRGVRSAIRFVAAREGYFNGFDLSRLDMSGLDLASSAFSNCDLTGADLSGAKLSNASMENLRGEEILLQGVDMTSGRILWSDLSGAQVERAHLRLLVGRVVKFNGAHMSQVCFKKADLKKCEFRLADVSGGDCIEGRFERCDFAGANLSGVKLNKAILIDCSFVGADLRGADFTNAEWAGCDFTDANLTGATIDIPTAEALRAIFTGVKLP